MRASPAAARMPDHSPIVVLGHQRARPGAAADLTALNVELAGALSTADPAARGLLAYQPLGNVVDPDQICVYWLWRDPRDRDVTWADPPDALQRFWRLARSLWRGEPVVGRYVWSPEPVHDLCPSGSQVVLSIGAAAAESSGSAARWLVPESGDQHGEVVRVEVITEPLVPPLTVAPEATARTSTAPDGTAAASIPGRWTLLSPAV